MRYQLIIQYDGSQFHGWQVQAKGRTVQGDIEKALSKIYSNDKINLMGAGRTDAGVHAMAQVAHVDLSDHLSSNELQKALNCFQMAINTHSDNSDAYNHQGLIFKKIGEYQKAQSSYKKAIQLKPNNASAYTNLGILLKEMGEYQNAINCYEKAIQINPNYANVYYNYGNILQELKEMKKAKSCYEKLLNLDPDYKKGYSG